MNNNQLQRIRKLRKAKDGIDPSKYQSLKQYAMDCIESGIGSQSYGAGAESIVGRLCGLEPEPSEDRGDFRFKDLSIEFKFSIVNVEGKMNFVQLRPSYKIDYYIFCFYDPCLEGDDLFETIICSAKDVYDLLPDYGGYAHGTIKENGSVTKENIQRNIEVGCEYVLRPKTRGQTKGARLLRELREINLLQEKLWEPIKNKLK